MSPSKLTRRFTKFFASNGPRCCVCKEAKDEDAFPDTEIHIEALGKQDVCEHCYHTMKDHRILHTN